MNKHAVAPAVLLLVVAFAAWGALGESGGDSSDASAPEESREKSISPDEMEAAPTGGAISIESPATGGQFLTGLPLEVRGQVNATGSGRIAITIWNGAGVSMHYSSTPFAFPGPGSYSVIVPTSTFIPGGGYRVRAAWRPNGGIVVRATSGTFTMLSPAAAAVVYRKPLFDFVYPTATPGPEISGISIRGCAGESEPETFVVRSAINLGDVSATVTDLAGPGVIPPNRVDIRVVKVWLQAGLHERIDTPNGVQVPELLVYDDAQDLAGGFADGGAYVPPTLLTPLRTDIPAGSSKQFWITVSIPAGIPSGTYTGTLALTTSGVVLRTIAFSVEVLPFALPKPTKTHGMFWYGNDSMTDAEIALELADLKAHGVRALRVPGGLSLLNRLLPLLVQAGIPGPIIVSAGSNSPETIITLLDEYGFPRYVYGVDEPNQLHQPTESHSLRHHIRKSYDIHQAGGKVATAIRRESSDLLDNPNSAAYDQVDPLTGQTFRQLGILNERLNTGIFQAHRLYRRESTLWQREAPLWNYIQGLRDGTIQAPTWRDDWMYWQSYIEFPRLMRMQTGFFLWTSKLDGVMPYLYMFRPSVPVQGDPFDDFDSGPQGNNYRDMMTVYPSAQGPIPTLRWEAFREGYDDCRYLTKFYSLLTQLQAVQPSLANQIRVEVETDLLLYHDPRDQDVLNGDQFTATRNLIIDKILLMQQVLN